MSESRDLAIRVVAMPGDTNPDGDMFGGWVMSQMDLGAWIQARKHTHHRVVTVAVENLVFHKPVFVGDCVVVYATTARVGRSSVTIEIDVMVERKESREVERVTEGRFIFVAIDNAWQSVPLSARVGSTPPEPDVH